MTVSFSLMESSIKNPSAVVRLTLITFCDAEAAAHQHTHFDQR